MSCDVQVIARFVRLKMQHCLLSSYVYAEKGKNTKVTIA